VSRSKVAQVRRRALGALVAAALLAVAGCSGSSSPKSTPTSPAAGTQQTSASSGDCPLSAKLVPSCGVLWGVSTSPKTDAALAALEGDVKRPFAVIYDYHDMTDIVPTQMERALVAKGRILHLAIAAREYGDDSKQVTYTSVAAGDYDATLTQQAKGIASLGVPVFVTFEQEGNQKRKLGTRGSAADWVAAWRHVHDVYVKAGATNAVWVWVMTGDVDNLTRAGQIWPGNSYVDWISWNVYNQSGCHSGKVSPALYASFQSKLTPFYNWVHTDGPKLGMDPTKPMMISESGSVAYPGDLAKSAGWYSSIPSVLASYPQIKAFALWDSKTSNACDYRFQNDPTMLGGATSAGQAGLVNHAMATLPKVGTGS
jgi:hypothetical protein